MAVVNELSDLTVGRELTHMRRVRSIHRDKIPKEMIINACNLKLNESVGQGNISVKSIPYSYMHNYLQENLELSIKQSCLKDSMLLSVKRWLLKH